MKKKEVERVLIRAMRHAPESLGLTLDKAGYASVSQIIEGLRDKGYDVNREDIEMLGQNERYRFDECHTKMRADYGNSTGLKLSDMYENSSQPPEILYHGTTVGALGGIQQEGIIRFQVSGKKARDHIFLTELRSVAWKKGNRRHGQPGGVLVVKAKEMYKAGYLFYHVKNDIWLTDHVPANYIDFGKTIFREDML
ncbi:MAG: RNA 2'-phosphotransferase [Lachnospiraceae bacterium]